MPRLKRRGRLIEVLQYIILYTPITQGKMRPITKRTIIAFIIQSHSHYSDITNHQKPKQNKKAK